MNITQRGIFFLIFFIATNANGQIWKKYVDSAKAYNEQINTGKTIEYYIKARNELRKDSVDTDSYGQVCDTLGILFYRKKQYKEAEEFFLEAKQIQEKLLGKEHPDYAEACNYLAILYWYMGQYEKAEPLYLEAKQIQEKVLGKKHLDYTTSCNNLAILYEDMGEYEKARPLLQEANQINKKILGKEHPGYVTSCNNLAGLYYYMGEYEKALPLFQEVKQMKERFLGKNHPDYAASCNCLANNYKGMGLKDGAESLLLEVKQIKERILGKEHPDYATSCNNLANLYNDKKQYKKAEPLYIEARQIRQKLLGKDHPDYAASCNDLANLYNGMGQYEKAEPLYIEAKQIRQKSLGMQSEEYRLNGDNLAWLYRMRLQFQLDIRALKEQTKIDIAIEYYPKAKNIQDSIFFDAYIQNCKNAGDLYFSKNRYENAEPFYLEARKVIRKKDQPVISEQNKLLLLKYIFEGGKDKSTPYAYSETKKIIPGRAYPDYIIICNDLGNLYWNLNKFEKANYFYSEAIKAQKSEIKKIFLFAGELEKQSYLNQVTSYEKYFLSFTRSVGFDSSKGFAYDISLSNRNLILSSSQELRKSIYNTSDTFLKNDYGAWINTKNQLSYWYTKPIAERERYVKILEEKSDTLEFKLNLFVQKLTKEEITWKNIHQKLQPKEAAIEFIDFNFFNGKRDTDSAFYIAILIRKDKPEPEVIKLFEKKQLSSFLNPTINNSARDITAYYNSIETGDINNISITNGLYGLIWEPMEKYLVGIEKIYFAPSGLLHRIAFAAIPINNKQVLSDKYQLEQLNTTASITHLTPIFITFSDDLRLYGGVNYDADSNTLKRSLQLSASNIEEKERMISFPDDIIRGGTFNYLPGTEEEVKEIKQQAEKTQVCVTVLSGSNASEESFKELKGNASPSVLHIATHGFFFPDPKEDKGDDIFRKFETSGKVFRQSENPLFRSGLLFAGANNTWKGKPVGGVEDGILTAYEVSNLYLPNTKLVVLSACETALGDIQGSEGVYGLQRSFKVAGVQNLVTSLWKVPDVETAEFMQDFYRNLFGGKSISNAFFLTQTMMKNKYRNEPYKWAAWILIR